MNKEEKEGRKERKTGGRAGGEGVARVQRDNKLMVAAAAAAAATTPTNGLGSSRSRRRRGATDRKAKAFHSSAWLGRRARGHANASQQSDHPPKPPLPTSPKTVQSTSSKRERSR